MSLLTQARAVIATPGSWTKGTNARNNAGHRINNVKATDAVCFCANGAVNRVTPDDAPNRAPFLRLNLAAQELFPERVRRGVFAPFVEVNDHTLTTHDDILKVFDRAIELETECQS